MRYDDYTDPETGEKWVNGSYAGCRQGSPLGDALNLGSDGYDHIRDTVHVGTKLGDALDNREIEEYE